MVASRHNFPLLKELLAEQQRLDTPVARFSAAHDRGALSALSPPPPSLIPLSRPGPGEQYAFQVDLDSCTGCKACVVACHSLNGLDDTETWRDVGLLVNDDARHPFQQTVTTACHHCADPACLNGCPVLAYEKDPATGIVRHLDDQCIGCQYCVMKCPYDVPKYNARLGIVRKCDMCHGRLAAGEAPACAQACPTHAISIVVVAAAATAALPIAHCPLPISESGPGGAAMSASPNRQFLPAAPAPEYTLPTTLYRTARALPEGIRAADAAVPRPQPPHWPLVIMLTLLPAAVGVQAAAGAVADYVTEPGGTAMAGRLAMLAWGSGAAGLAASVFHLGQPMRAWRIFLGWRRSWLSREAMAFGLWFALATAALVSPVLIGPAALVGGGALLCSAMIYVDTRRNLWRASQAIPRFLGTAAVLGAAAALALGAPLLPAAVAFAVATVAKLAVEARAVRPWQDADEDAAPTPALASARLLMGPFRVLSLTRLYAAAILAGLLVPALVAGEAPAGWRWVVLAGALAGELAERYLFFRAVDAPKMPGVTTGGVAR